MHLVFRINATRGPRSAHMARGRGLQDSSTITPLRAVASGLLAGAVSTLAMDALRFARDRRGGDHNGFRAWEFSSRLSRSKVVTATPTARSHLQRAALAGAATGLRSTVGTAALINAGAPGLPEALTRRHPKAAARRAVAVELVFDKLPSAPSRLARRGLTARIVHAGIAGAVVARGANQPALPAVLVASTTAVVSARVGHEVRVAASDRFPPLLVAAAEDGIALSLAAASTSLRRPGRSGPAAAR